MRRPSFNGSAFIFAAALTAFASFAEAQRATGPFSGVLGAAADTEASHSLDVRGSLFGSWDDTLSRSDDGVAIDERYLRSGGAAGATGSIAHARRSSRFTWQSSASSSARFYGADDGPRAGTFNGLTSINSTLSRRVSISGSGGWTYSPYYGFAPGFDGRLSNVGAFGGGFGAATAAERSTATTAGAGLNVRLSRRDTLEFKGSANRYKFLDQESTIDRWGAGAQFRHTLTRSLGFHLGFGREEARYQVAAGEAPATTDTIDAGIDYGDTLTFSRRTAFSFRTSTSAVKWNNDTHYRLNGTAGLTQGFGRSGSAALNYTRGTEFDPAFREPLLRDDISAGVNNQFGRRVSWSAQAGYSRGSIGFGSTAGHYNTYNAGGGVNVALTRRIGLFSDYSVYRYEVPAGSTVFTSLQKFSRQSVSAGLSLWAPLISDKRSPSDSR